MVDFYLDRAHWRAFQAIGFLSADVPNFIQTYLRVLRGLSGVLQLLYRYIDLDR